VLVRSAFVFLAISAVATSAAFARTVSISQEFKGDTIKVTVDGTRFAGAISSVTLRNVQYVDVADHGREIQSAIQVDALGECFNPNEAGSDADHAASTSSSRLISISNAGNVLKTVTQAAFWLAPGQKYGRLCSPRTNVSSAQNKTVMSDYIITRRTSFYGRGIPNLVRTDVTFTIPEKRASASIEALTGYLPASFDNWFEYDLATHSLVKLRASSANQRTTSPVIVATADGKNAMGIISPGISPGNSGRGYYAYFTFGGRTPSSKWACVYNQGPVSLGTRLTYTCLFAVGTLNEVVSALSAYPMPR
jgi:hypothetical protein